MSLARRTAAIGALLILVLLIAELATWGNPQVTDPISKLTDYFVGSRSLALISVFISMVLAIVYLVFGAAVRATINAASARPSAVLGDITLGAAVLMAGCQLSLALGTGALALVGADATETEVRLLVGLVSMMDLFRVLALGVMVGAISIAALRDHLVGRWIGWVGVVASALLLVSQVAVLDPTGPIGNMGNASMVGLLFLVVWFIAFGVSLLRSAPAGDVRWTSAERVPG
jgi:hypothetical protein